MTAWNDNVPANTVELAEGIRYDWRCDTKHDHTIDCLWIWHDCAQILGENSVAPGDRFGWRPAGVGAHTLVQVEPLTIVASVYWPDCCGRHGFITDGVWVEV